MSQESRPVDALNQSKGKRVIVRLRAHGSQSDEGEMIGILKAFDLHLNLWLEEAEFVKDNNKTKLGTVVLRGDNILFVSPE
ncbi:MAG: small nuclear ribonucleoprotein (Sm) [Candidatus Aenigmarchaeota archaeon]|nr:small nuclear ribonucleoprotein (Sm) [Candidatus Aenigmarchaeota archaeon]